MNVYVVATRNLKEGEECTGVLSVNRSKAEALESIHQQTIRNKGEYKVEDISREMDNNNGVFFTKWIEYTIHKTQLE